MGEEKRERRSKRIPGRLRAVIAGPKSRTMRS